MSAQDQQGRRPPRYRSCKWLPAILFLGFLGWNGTPVLWAQNPNIPGGSYADLAEQVQHAVVNISATKTVSGPAMPFSAPGSPMEDFFNRFFGEGNPQMERQARALGTGFILDEQGLILTNNHVVAQAEEIKILLADQKSYDARIIGRDPKTDLALLKVEPDKGFPPPVKLGDSDAMRVGDQVMAVGNPFSLGHTVTVGIISAKSRFIGAGNYDDFIQTDAAINPGNSGGPLFNMQGEVVGINTAIVASGQGIGFAIPINLARDLLPQLKTGRVVRGWLGVVIQEITPELAQSFGLKEPQGVLVADIAENGPAAEAGLRRGDVILSIDGQKVDDPRQLSRMIAAIEPGKTAKLKLHRDGKTQDMNVTIGTLPDEEDKEPAADPSAQSEKKWGFSLQTLTPELAQRLGWPEDESGVLITQVNPSGAAGRAGLQRGDLIKEVNRKTVHNRNDLLNNLDEGELLLLVKRGENTIYVQMKK